MCFEDEKPPPCLSYLRASSAVIRWEGGVKKEAERRCSSGEEEDRREGCRRWGVLKCSTVIKEQQRSHMKATNQRNGSFSILECFHFSQCRDVKGHLTRRSSYTFHPHFLPQSQICPTKERFLSCIFHNPAVTLDIQHWWPPLLCHIHGGYENVKNGKNDQRLFPSETLRRVV